MDCATLSSNDKINYWPRLPIELHHAINDFLSVYDSFNLSSTSHFFRPMFFTLALRPDYKKDLQDAVTEYQATLTGKIFLHIANIAHY